jgi:nucleoside-diphosphate-sugar epimerase
MAQKVVVLGARGRLGWAVTQAFAHAGWEVVAQLRPGSAARSAVPGVTWQVVDVTDAQALAACAQGAKVVVHAMNPASYTEAAWAAQAPGMTDAAIALAKRLGALLLFPGNVYGFGADLPPVLLPDTPQQPSNGMGRIRCGLEQQVAQATRRGVNAVILRAGDFFGSGQGSWLDRVLAKDVAQGRFTYPGNMDAPHAWAYLPDLAQAFVQVAQAWQPQAGGRLETVHFAGHTVTGRDWLQALEAHAGQPLKVGTLPWWAMRLLAWFKPELATLVAMRYLWDRPHALAQPHPLAGVGSATHTPFDEAVRRALAA